jgi:hypothetical protein
MASRGARMPSDRHRTPSPICTAAAADPKPVIPVEQDESARQERGRSGSQVGDEELLVYVGVFVEQVVLDLVPDEDDPGWNVATGFAQNSVIAVCHAVEVANGAETPAAVQCAFQLYEAGEYAAQIRLVDLDPNDSNYTVVINAQPEVGIALDSIDTIITAVSSGPIPEIRARSRQLSAALVQSYLRS